MLSGYMVTRLGFECVDCEEVNGKMFEFPIHSSTPRGEVSGRVYSVTYSLRPEYWLSCLERRAHLFEGVAVCGLQVTCLQV